MVYISLISGILGRVSASLLIHIMPVQTVCYTFHGICIHFLKRFFFSFQKSRCDKKATPGCLKNGICMIYDRWPRMIEKMQRMLYDMALRYQFSLLSIARRLKTVCAFSYHRHCRRRRRCCCRPLRSGIVHYIQRLLRSTSNLLFAKPEYIFALYFVDRHTISH